MGVGNLSDLPGICVGHLSDLRGSPKYFRGSPPAICLGHLQQFARALMGLLHHGEPADTSLTKVLLYFLKYL